MVLRRVRIRDQDGRSSDSLDFRAGDRAGSSDEKIAGRKIDFRILDVLEDLDILRPVFGLFHDFLIALFSDA